MMPDTVDPVPTNIVPVARRKTEIMARNGSRPVARRRPGATSAAEYAVLASLAMAGGSGHGYDLSRQFSSDRPLGEVIRLEPGMLYHHLKKLEKAGWATAETQPQGHRAPRQIHTITTAGSTALRRWLAEPVTRTREIRLEFLVKLYITRRLEPDRVDALIDAQTSALEDALARLDHQANEIPDDEPDAEFARDVIALRQGQTRAALEWLDGLG